MMKLLRAALAAIALLGAPLAAFAATLLPPGQQTFIDANGVPLSGGKVYFYIPSTTTPKNTWQDSGQTILNANPVVLDSAGRAIIYGSGTYRQIVKDSLGNTIWDQLTADTNAVSSANYGGTSTGSANAQVITASGFTATDGQIVYFIAGFTNASALTVQTSGVAAVSVRKDLSTGSTALTGGEVVAGNEVFLIYDATAGVFHITNPAVSQASVIVSPQGRVTLTSGVPVLTSAVTAATTVYYTPYVGNNVPIYNGTAFVQTAFTELSVALDSNAAHTGYQQSGKSFDIFVEIDSGTTRLCTGPAWSTDTTRGSGAGTTELTRVSGIEVNNVSIVCRWGTSSLNTVTVAANQATYVGTMRASADGQTQVKFGTTAAAGGEAWLGLWNMYNRVPFTTTVVDSNTITFSGAATWVSADASVTNRVTFTRGLNEDGVTAFFGCNIAIVTANGSASLGINLDSTSATPTAAVGTVSTSGTGTFNSRAFYSSRPGLGLHYLQAMQIGDGLNANTCASILLAATMPW